MNLHRMRNLHAVQRLAKPAAKGQSIQKWTPLSEPVLPLDTMARIRAQSLLTGLRYRDGSTNPNALTLDQAHDVLRWATGVCA